MDAAGLHPTPGSKPTSRGLPPAATRPLPVPPAFSGYVAKVQREVDAVLAAFPEDTPPAVLCHSIGYVLQAKYSWHVKLCCKVCVFLTSYLKCMVMCVCVCLNLRKQIIIQQLKMYYLPCVVIWQGICFYVYQFKCKGVRMSESKCRELYADLHCYSNFLIL